MIEERRESVEYVGPFESWRVSVDGWEVPLLHATPQPGGKVSLTLDSRFGLDLDLATAERVVPFIANAIAVAMGYAAHPNGEQPPILRSPTAPHRLTAIDLGETEDA